jgi:hypothetical protein
MSSFDLSYDSEDDVLEITFGLYDETVARTVPLNDNILLFSDLALQTVWGISFYSYSKLLEVSETEFTLLGEMTESQRGLVLRLLSREPASYFFDITYPDTLIARIVAPNLRRLIRSRAD